MTSDGKLTEEEKADILSAFVKLLGQDAMDAPVGEDLTATVLVETTAKEIKQEQQEKNRASAATGAAASAPAGITPRAAAKAKNQDEDDDQ